MEEIIVAKKIEDAEEDTDPLQPKLATVSLREISMLEEVHRQRYGDGLELL